jgi:hypothetical protein
MNPAGSSRCVHPSENVALKAKGGNIRSRRKAKPPTNTVSRCRSETPFPPDLINLKRPYVDFFSIFGKNAL